jgi:hypothetical protein
MTKASLSLTIGRAMAVANIFYKIVEEKFGEKSYQYLRFPRDIEMIVSDSLELPIITQPNLTLHSASLYLCIRRAQQAEDRSLQGLLHVGPPANMILVEEHLSPCIKNYVIAHEIGHYVHDIFMVKQLWLGNLHKQKRAIIAAFSWQKYDPWLELQALLKSLPDRPRPITKRGKGMLQETREREIFANAVALELLAPWHEASTLFRHSPRHEVIKRLREQYGVPARIAEGYYRDLQRTLSPQPDLFDQLFAPLLD